MSKKAIVTRPNHDHTTSYLFRWAHDVIAGSEKNDVEFIDLAGKKATRKELEGRLKKIKPALIFLNGHGNQGIVTGQALEPLIVAGENESLLSGSITYALSCSSAVYLGPQSVKSGAKAYIGYIEDFVFMFDESYLTHPERDTIASKFLTPAYSVIRALIKGNSASEATKRGVDLYKKEIRSLLTSEASSDAAQMLPHLVSNMQSLRCIGDENAKISD